MSYKVVLGNLFATLAPLIMQQVNARGVMGAGIAKDIRNDISTADFYKYRNHVLGNPNALGTVIPTKSISTPNRTYLNIVGQQNYGRDPNTVYTDYNALETAFNKIAAKYPEGTEIAMPYGMGAGLANGDWNKIEDLAKNILGKSMNVTAYKLK